MTTAPFGAGAAGPVQAPAGGIVGRYIELGLRLGRHVDGLVDAYYGPPVHAGVVAAEPLSDPGKLLVEARGLIADIDAGLGLDEGEPQRPDVRAASGRSDRQASTTSGSSEVVRRRWLRAQCVGLATTASILSGQRPSYSDEVEACYGVRPVMVPEEALASAHHQLDDLVPGTGSLPDRYIAWRESQAVPPNVLGDAISSLCNELRALTAASFGLAEGESVEFELVSAKPWSGFNYYLGSLRSRVAVNTDLPVLSSSLGVLVAHETYPGHHTEHSTKETALVRARGHLEETIFLVGTPQCLVSEGLADLALEIVAGGRPESFVAEHLRELSIPYDSDLVAAMSEPAKILSAVRGNAALLLHEHGQDPSSVVEYLSRWALLPRARAEKQVEFLLDPTWRSYISCYVEGYPLCRRFVGGDPERFRRLLAEQLVPADLAAA